MTKRTLLVMATTIACLATSAQTLVDGGQFMDRILPMEGNDLRSDTWGAPGVKPRLVDNGIEDNIYSYWGGNIVKGEDGRYHLNIAGWPENSSKGHNTWSSGSMVYHAVSDSPHGPYKNVKTIGSGHNAETYRAKDGTWVIYIINGRYTTQSLDGPWEASTFEFDKRGRALIAGNDPTTSLSNCTFAQRQDSSYLMMDRGGGIWISKDGLSAYRQLTDKTVYSGNRRYLEDPVVWRDSLQYHMIVNDWNARIAYYSRSVDGLHWVTEPGTAYEPGVARHADGTVEDWYKYERPKVYLDESGRAAYFNLAVIDTIKAEDKGSDNHSSKNIVMPLNKGMFMEVLNTEPLAASTNETRVLIKAEEGFNPQTDLDLSTLTFGCYTKVNYGDGLKATASAPQGDDLIITFTGTAGQSGITTSEFAPKMIGKNKQGGMVYGYARLPYVNYRPAILSAMMPTVDDNNEVTHVLVENFGLSTAEKTQVRVLNDKGTVLSEGEMEPLAPYDSVVVALTAKRAITGSTENLVVVFLQNNKEIDRNTLSATDIVVNQNELKDLIASACTQMEDASMPNGRAELQAAIDEASLYVNRFSLTATSQAIAALMEALTAFQLANGVSTQTFDFYSWAMKDNTSLSMDTKTVSVKDGATTVSVPVASYVTDGKNRQHFDGRIAFSQGSRYFDLRNNGIDNASSGLFDFQNDSYFCVLNLNPGDKVTFNITGVDATFVSTNVYKEDSETTPVKKGDTVVSGVTYVVSGTRSSNLVIKGEHYTTIKLVKVVSFDQTATNIDHIKEPQHDGTYYTLQGFASTAPLSKFYIQNQKKYWQNWR